MKKIFVAILATCALGACNNASDAEHTSADTVVTVETPVAPPVASRTPVDGDIAYNGGRVQVYRVNTWEDSREDIKMTNGTVVRRDGKVIRDGNEYVMEDGYVLDRDGNVWDRTGAAVSDAWDATKRGAKKAGQAIENAVEKTGDKVKDAVN
jgi:hypothetical protein